MKKLIICTLLVIVTVYSFAQENVNDFTNLDQEINEYGVPTLESVDKVGNEANMQYFKENWSQAAKTYELYYQYCNLLTHLLYKLAEPHIISERDAYMINLYYPDLVSEFENLEKKLYHYWAEKDKAIHRQGICFFNLGDYKKSLPLIIQSLDLNKLDNNSSIEEYKMWEEAKTALYSMIKYDK